MWTWEVSQTTNFNLPLYHKNWKTFHAITMCVSISRSRTTRTLPLSYLRRTLILRRFDHSHARQLVRRPSTNFRRRAWSSPRTIWMWTTWLRSTSQHCTRRKTRAVSRRKTDIDFCWVSSVTFCSRWGSAHCNVGYMTRKFTAAGETTRWAPVAWS